ncbi:hypothetical protein RDV84_02580 [Lysobacter yananisis]|uniref:Uncharacterized protein n=1 Tax=Lysobacter yananisis TaxID=1003114 RepID=A0ABY9PA31_9GAMM|nr:hypothetical protein [Lysobacter yananisis]WMT03751.1 hypothetical protein RDV84_02580 [Lysobacter yananisis]
MSAEPIGTGLRARLDEFARQPGVTAEAARNLEAAIVRSPALTRQLNAAADSRELRHFELKSDAHAGGSAAHRRAGVAMQDALRTPVEESSRQASALPRETPTPAPVQSETQTPSQPQPAHR